MFSMCSIQICWAKQVLQLAPVMIIIIISKVVNEAIKNPEIVLNKAKKPWYYREYGIILLTVPFSCWTAICIVFFWLCIIRRKPSDLEKRIVTVISIIIGDVLREILKERGNRIYD